MRLISAQLDSHLTTEIKYNFGTQIRSVDALDSITVDLSTLWLGAGSFETNSGR